MLIMRDMGGGLVLMTRDRELAETFRRKLPELAVAYTSANGRVPNG